MNMHAESGNCVTHTRPCFYITKPFSFHCNRVSSSHEVVTCCRHACCRCLMCWSLLADHALTLSLYLTHSHTQIEVWNFILTIGSKKRKNTVNVGISKYFGSWPPKSSKDCGTSCSASVHKQRVYGYYIRGMFKVSESTMGHCEQAEDNRGFLFQRGDEADNHAKWGRWRPEQKRSDSSGPLMSWRHGRREWSPDMDLVL